MPLVLCALALLACGGDGERFPLRDPLWVDRDDLPYSNPCVKNDEGELECMPEKYVSPLAWDAVDNTIFRPISRFFAVDPGGEAINVNSFDEVPDSSWFQNRIGKRPLTREQLLAGACEATEALLDPNGPAGSWLVDMGKQDGATPGFRVRTKAGGKFLLKADRAEVAERASSAGLIGSRLYHAAGFNTPCERIVYIHPSILKLKPGLESTDNTGITRAFDQAALDRILKSAAWREGKVRLAASQWLPNPTLGPFKYEGTRCDDPNDVVAHEDRRELRGGRLIAAWINHFDSREQNTMDTWVSVSKQGKTASPGYVRHYYLDFSDSFGSEWDWDGISRRLGHSYYLDFEHILEDTVTLGLLDRPWESARRTQGAEIFNYYRAEDFVPEAWQPGYPNPAFQRMTERDGAWMARILARFTRDDLRALVELADLSKPFHAAFLEYTLYERRQRILRRYFARLSPLADVIVSGDELCAVDLARRARVFADEAYRYRARSGREGEPVRELRVRDAAAQTVCAALGRPSAAGYFVVTLENGAAGGALAAHLYDLGPARGYKLVGLVRDDP